MKVLPNRTHPTMNMSAASGFILAGTKVAAVVHLARSDDSLGDKDDKKRPGRFGESEKKRAKAN